MSNEKVVVQSGGIGVAGLLGIVFIVLKLTGYIGWSWWWVTAPFWMPWVIFLGLGAIIGTGVFLWKLKKGKK